MRAHHVRALTGLRFVAALWVVLYHVSRHNQGVLQTSVPDVDRLTRPLLDQGIHGVDLFFVLSGFVLALNYLDQLGPRPDLRTTGRFLWLRLARVWPLYVAVLLAAGTLIGVRDRLWGSAPAGQVDGWHLVQQLLLVQQWFGTASWSGPAWSVSAEWLAYLLCPVLALVVLRLRDRLRARALYAAVLVAVSPCVVLAVSQGSFSGPGGWAVRVVAEFTAGMLLCAAVSRTPAGRRTERLAGLAAVLGLVAMVAVFYASYPLPSSGWVRTLASVLLVPVVVGGLALGTGPLASALASAPLVLGGKVSYALYLVHSPLLYLLRDTLTEGLGVPRGPLTVSLEVAWVPVLIGVAWVLWRWVEEPSRHFLRAMLPPLQPASAPGSGQGDRATGEPFVVREVPVDRDPADEPATTRR